MRTNTNKYLCDGLVVLAVLFAAVAWADYPPLCLEISPDHPLFLFQHPGDESLDTGAYAQLVIQAWNQLPGDLHTLSAIQVEARGPDAASRHAWFR
ncbi:MAG TPA: hypothetical protein PKO36_16660, partial [Candidatus Hydrogenedentes bacterium]|nr:hypothetical protein [Candidatus Hydrogenedentota bacterium]